MSASVALLTQLPPELSHAAALEVAARLPTAALRVIAQRHTVRDPRLVVRAFGLTFPTPIGLAAGYDKDARAVPALFAFGFGHVEVGTVTRLAQPGNTGPRLFRVREVDGLVNRLGFPSAGVATVVDRLRRLRAAPEPLGGVLGVNIGKNKDVPLEQAPAEYAALYREVAEVADYVAVNVSSPNTAGLRSLQSGSHLGALLRAVVEARALAPKRPPVLVKISPDLSEDELDVLVEEAIAAGVDGLIATNTTLAREGLPPYAQRLVGGLSGRPLAARALEVLRGVVLRAQGRVPIVSVGGVSSAADALERLRAGATLVQLYTALVYRGPALVRDISHGILAACEREGVSVAGLRGQPRQGGGQKK